MKTQSTTSIEHRASGEKHNLSLRGEAEAIPFVDSNDIHLEPYFLLLVAFTRLK